MRVNIFHYFVAGIVGGFILGIIFPNEPIDLVRVSPVQRNSNKIIESKRFDELKKIRILCMLNTNPDNHNKRAVHIQQTWGKHCDKVVFASTLTNVNLNAIGFNITDGHGYVFGKQKLMMQHVYKNYLHQYDWFYKADDDTFANIENMRFLLSAYSPNDSIFFGYKFFTTFHRWGYFSGGAGYVLSKTALREFAEKSLRNESLCPQLVRDNVSEDWNVPYCLAKLNVFAGDGRDPLKRERFLMGPPKRHLFNESESWYWKRKYYMQPEGPNCCSKYTISFHYIYERYLYTMYFLTYHLRPYGIAYQHPPLPKKHNFKEVKQTLEMDRINVFKRRVWE